MNRLAYVTAVFALGAGAAMGQSTITLDSFDLNDRAPEAVAPVASASDEMRDCILQPENCQNTEYGGGADISLDDVVNLGVIDRSQVKEDEKVAQTAPLPSIDIEVLFAYDSDALTYEAQSKLADLANVLRDPRFDNHMLLFIGHTDSVGSAAYNQALSERRARSVANYVQNALYISPSRVQARGMGFSRLKNYSYPESPENRRVQLVLVAR